MGVGQTSFEREKDDTFEEMVFEAVTGGVVGCRRGRFGVSTMSSRSPMISGRRTISSMSVITRRGLGQGRPNRRRPSRRDGIFGAIYGAMRTLAGSFDTTLVVAHAKGSMGRMNLITNGMFDPLYQRHLGIDATIGPPPCRRDATWSAPAPRKRISPAFRSKKSPNGCPQSPCPPRDGIIH